ncbi:MAG TPA: hypothetical protein VE912_08965 [Bacteroidales bacterium]|nr:hypothetical protein [Bacteroidales bacterium]
MKKSIFLIVILSTITLFSCSHSDKKSEAFTTIHINPAEAAPVKFSTLYSRMEM